MNKDYLIEIKVKNNYLAMLMKSKGITTASELSRQSGVPCSTIGNIINLKSSAFNQSGEYTLPVQKLSKFFNVLPESLFPEQHLYMPLAKNKVEIEMSLNELSNIISHDSPETLMLEHENSFLQSEAIQKALASLTDRQQTVIKGRLFEGKTLGEIAKTLPRHDNKGSVGVSSNLVRIIECRALKRLKHTRHKNLREFYEVL